ncbi:MAG: putative inorganic carbon transporter subunit DabA, partial [Jannaschia sp.]
AGCHAFVAGPRSATRGLDLGGRVFLHDYDWRADQGYGTLTLILTAPVVVASWIALQYHGSTVAPETFGAGDKLLHNVTGGIGVIEGSAGNLRTGLPWQSVHDGDVPRHEAGRLMVVVAAPPEAIADVLGAHPDVAALFDNGWLSLHILDDMGHLSHRWQDGRFLSRQTLAEVA